MHFIATAVIIDTSTVVAVVFGIVSVALTLASLYIAFRQLQLAAYLRLRLAVSCPMQVTKFNADEAVAMELSSGKQRRHIASAHQTQFTAA